MDTTYLLCATAVAQLNKYTGPNLILVNDSKKKIEAWEKTTSVYKQTDICATARELAFIWILVIR